MWPNKSPEPNPIGAFGQSVTPVEQMPKKRLAALQKLITTLPTKMKTTYRKNGPRRQSKFFADGSALVAVKGGGTLLIESQPQYKTAGSKDKSAKPRRRRPPNVLTAPVK